MKYVECEYLKPIANTSSSFKLALHLCNKFSMPIVSYVCDYKWTNVLQFYNYLTYLRFYKQRILDAAKAGKNDEVEKLLKTMFEKTYKQSIDVYDTVNIPSGWLCIIKQLYHEVSVFNEEYENACLEGQIRKM